MDDDKKSPSKPKPSTATTQDLLRHYHAQLPAYNAKVLEAFAGDQKRIDELLMQEFPADYPEDLVIRDNLVERIRRQNHRLGRHIKARSHELLLLKLRDPVSDELLKKDGRYTLGLEYQKILDTLAVEFPEASTSVACLRWYVVKMKENARDEGSEWPDLPNIRPRSKAKAIEPTVTPETSEEAA